MDLNHEFLKILFDLGFNVKFDYSGGTKVHRALELKTVIESKSFELFKILVENGRRETKNRY